MKKGGIGGANTNLHGLKFESDTDLATNIAKDLSHKYHLRYHHFNNKENLVLHSKSPAYDVIRRSDNKLIGVITKQNQFYNVLYDSYCLINANAKRWKPDEAFFNFATNTIFIIEKKWQQRVGSTDEKVFGFVNKRRLYQLDFNQLSKEPKPSVEFASLFNSNWWLSSNNSRQYQDYFNTLRVDGIRIFFDNYDYWWFGL